MRSLHFLPLILISFLSLVELRAQTAARFFWAGLSANNYRGDLQDGIPHYGPGLHVGIKLNKAPKLNGSFALGFGKVSGQDPDFNPDVAAPVQPNRYFTSSFFTLDYSLQYHILKKDRYQLWLSQGIGLFRYNPKDQLDRQLQDQGNTRPGSESYGNISLQLPTSLGAAVYLPNQWGIGLQASYLNPLTDFLDNIASLGNNKGNDNVLQFRLMLLVPIKKQ